MFKATKRIAALVLTLCMLFAMTATAYAYDESCTITIPAGISVGGYLTLKPYVGFGKNLTVEIVDGLDEMDYDATKQVNVSVTRVSGGKSHVFNLAKVKSFGVVPIAFAGSGDYRVTAYNGTDVEVKIRVFFGPYSG